MLQEGSLRNVFGKSAALREEVFRLRKLIEHAQVPEKHRDVHTKLIKSQSVLSEEGIFDDPHMKLLIFTEHKDTLDYLAGDCKDGARRFTA